MADFVFHDPSGRRARRLGLAVGLILSFVAATGAGFAVTLAMAPHLPDVRLKDPRVLSALHQETARKHPIRPTWTRVPRPGVLKSAAAGAIRPLTVAFYVSWDPESRQSLSDHISKIDVVAPQWLQLNGATGAMTLTEDPQADAIIAAAPRPPSVLPVIFNFNTQQQRWDGAVASAMVLNPAARKVMIDRLVDLANKRGYAGYVMDLEELSPQAIRAYPGFLAQVRAALRPLGRELWATAPVDEDQPWPLKTLQDNCDALVLMAFDEHYQTGDPGPPASQSWFQAHVSAELRHLDPNRTIVALGSYGYDWPKEKGAKSFDSADAMTFSEAMVRANDAGVNIDYDSDALNPTFGYTDEDDGEEHQVWFLDAATLFNQIRVVDPWRPRGYGLWRLGSEDPGVWSLFGRGYGREDTSGLAALPGGTEPDFDGTGEVLKVTATPKDGKRSWTVDPGTGLISDENYDVIPTGYVIERYGARPGKVALTFDDGPDPRWTPKILDILKQKQANATFFVIGQNMADWPSLVKREIDEGNVVGNHSYTHPNIGAISTPQVDLELNATQRLFEVVTGKSMRLFRPPYFGDAEPSTPAEITPLLKAQALGYLIVGLRIDPDDWKKPDPTHIVNATIQRLADTNPDTGGQVVLLHDSGGDRSRTVAALPQLIDQLRAHGYQLVTIADLAGMTPAQAMPPTQRDIVELTLDRIGFGFVHGVDVCIYTLLVTAIALGLARLAFLSTLALWHRFTSGPPPPMLDPKTGPLVSVLIPCFNEEKVIVSSAARILQSDWTNIEVLVLDDGSTDDTAGEVERAFGDDPRVRLMRFANGGKAEALNKGLAVAKGDIVVALDADTLFPAATIGRLVRWFQDPGIGAVAGNALVGNRLNMVTRWQALEYVTAQNLERRALDALGAVTVVPGAVGAWRRSALEALGGYPADTLAEDQDLTMAIQRAGWKVDFDSDARAFTEAPDTIKGLLKQRFRWSFGTLQCLWKHREALFDPKRPILGFVALPQIWLFQIILTVAAPLVDLAAVWSIISAVMAHYSHPVEWSSDDLVRELLYWTAFTMVDLSAAALGMALEKRAPWWDIIWLPVQRFGYRQMMYYVVVKAVLTALRGPRVTWGKLERRNTAVAGAS
jgi:cellulose synthase/poly-beta-1,6-N-acetylglucosamine synthase-like glycosyltransferase/peptidoglycan/xylan/chitin deacetylase (PgdA/CDA1 family)/spore germination protein YaaH